MFLKSTEYAIRATLYIAQKGTIDEKLSIQEISKAINAPKPYTAKILQMLSTNEIVCSTPGPGGGFYMTGKARKLSMNSLLIAIGEEGFFDTCILGLSKCSDEKPCPMHIQYKPLKEKLKRMFEGKTIGSLSQKLDSGNAFVYY
ncbi:MAG: Rrf2 family transcriptional regulator [Bacteroidetes bacterium]|nr:Rrf2 family transcriptional regulator [Bacteroidota bacterium]